MKTLSKADLESFKEAIYKDYGIKLEGDELYLSAFNLLQFFEGLIKFIKEDEQAQVEAKGSKTVQSNPLKKVEGNTK